MAYRGESLGQEELGLIWTQSLEKEKMSQARGGLR
jgi:hypothetical protein